VHPDGYIDPRCQYWAALVNKVEFFRLNETIQALMARRVSLEEIKDI
jgi:hypothetical protein